MLNKNKKQIVNFIYLQLLFFIYSLAGLASKKASQYKFLSQEFLKYYLVELFVIFIYAFLWQQIIKKYDIVIAYASKGVVIIWMMIWSVMFFKENIKFNNIIGAIIIVCGIWMVSRDDK